MVPQGHQEGGQFDGVSRPGGGIGTGIPTQLGVLHLTLFSCYPKTGGQDLIAADEEETSCCGTH